MHLLLDTHTLIWFADGNSSISSIAKAAIENPSNKKFISIISFYEIAIKLKIEKLTLDKPLNDYFKNAVKQGIMVLPISENHLTAYNTVPLFTEHKDPFDRLLIATAMVEKLTIVTADKKFNLYKELVDIKW